MESRIRGYKYYRNIYQLGTAVIGSPSITDNGIAGNFTSINYMKLPSAFNPGSQPWEWVMAFKLTGNQTGGYLTGTYINNATGGVNQLGGPYDGWHYASPEDKGFFLSCSRTQIVAAVHKPIPFGGQISYKASGTANLTIQSDVMYTVTFKFDGLNYEMIVQEGDNTPVTYPTTKNSTDYLIDPIQTQIGFHNRYEGHAEWAHYTNYVFNGTVDLFHSYIKINGQAFWENKRREETSQADYEANITNLDYFRVEDILLRNYLASKIKYAKSVGGIYIKCTKEEYELTSEDERYKEVIYYVPRVKNQLEDKFYIIKGV